MSKVRHFRDARTSEICIQMAAGNIDSVDALRLMQERIDALIASYEAKVQDFAAETLRTGELTACIAELEQKLLLRAECNHPSHSPSDTPFGLPPVHGGYPPLDKDEQDAIDRVLGREIPSSHE